MADQAVQLQELRQLNAELEDEIEVLLAKGAGQEQAAQVAQLEEELERLELALEGRGGGAGELGRLRREKRALQQERDELEEQLQSGAGLPTGTGGGGDPVARAAELEERMRSLQLFGAMNVVGAELPEKGTKLRPIDFARVCVCVCVCVCLCVSVCVRERVLHILSPAAGTTGFEAFRSGPSEAELEEMDREREELEEALEEAEEIAKAAAEENIRLEDEKAELMQEKARLEEKLQQAEARAVAAKSDSGSERGREDSGSDVAAMRAQVERYKEEMRVLNSEVEEVEDELDAALTDKAKAERERDEALAEVQRLRDQLS